MKKIIFPCTNRVHEARQSVLLKELSKQFQVTVFKPNIKYKGDLAIFAEECNVSFLNFIKDKKYDFALIRADRAELLNIANSCMLKGFQIIHIEGGNETGLKVVDSRIRHAITQLADIHLVTDEPSKRKVISLGAEIDKTFNVGSIDVSYAKSVTPKRIIEEDYILFLHHALKGEETVLAYDAIKNLGYKVVGVKSNQDYQKSLMTEEYSPEDFISLMYYAKCMVGNSSAACKESSILGTPVVLTGRRQDGRIVGHNVLRVPHNQKEIEQAVRYQIDHGRFEPDEVYYKPYTEKMIADIIKTF